ncbi:hypothetical protein [Chitinimonas naiadis]
MPVPHFSLNRRRKRRILVAQPETPDTTSAPLQLPHEHDQSPDSQSGGPHRVIKQAKEDIDRGIVDTDRRSAYGLGEDRGLKSRPPKLPVPKLGTK